MLQVGIHCFDGDGGKLRDSRQMGHISRQCAMSD